MDYIRSESYLIRPYCAGSLARVIKTNYSLPWPISPGSLQSKSLPWPNKGGVVSTVTKTLYLFANCIKSIAY